MAQVTAVKTSAVWPQARLRRPVDLVYLARLCKGDEQLECAMLRQFERTVSQQFAQLIAAKTPADMRLHLQAIMAAAGGAGVTAVAGLAQELIASGTPPTAEALADLGHAIEEARSFIGDMLA